MKELIVATKNKGKAVEFKEYFSKYNIKALSLLDIDENIPDIEETGTTFTENAALKAEQVAKIVNKPVLADDSGLIIDALDGKPGIHSARYAGDNSHDQANIDKVMFELKNIPKNERTARFIAVIAVSIPGKETIFKTGYCEGVIALEQKGTGGFGYDPIFIPENSTKTMADISFEEKNAISHRTNAMQQLQDLANLL